MTTDKLFPNPPYLSTQSERRVSEINYSDAPAQKLPAGWHEFRIEADLSGEEWYLLDGTNYGFRRANVEIWTKLNEEDELYIEIKTV